MNWKLFAAAAPLSVFLLATGVQAAPSVRLSGSMFSVKEALTDEIVAQIKADQGKVRDMSKLAFDLSKVSNEDVAKICSLYPGMAELRISDSKKSVTDIAPVAGLKNLKKLRLQVAAPDLSPVSGLTGLTSLEVNDDAINGVQWMSQLTNLTTVEVGGERIASFKGLPSLPNLKRANFYNAKPDDLAPLVEALPGLTDLKLHYNEIKDLSPLTKLAGLKDLSLYGATVKDFSPLAGCPALRSLMYYAVKDADFSTLGKLTQVTELKGGLTKLDNIDWVANLPNLKKFDVFAEYVTDYSPLTKINLEDFQIWSMRVPVGDLAPVGQFASLKKLKLWDVNGAANSAALTGLSGLGKFTIDGYNAKEGEPFDFSSASGWKNLKELEIRKTNGINTANLGTLSGLEKLNISDVNLKGEAFDLGFLKGLTGLKYLTINNSKVTGLDAIAGCTSLVNVTLTKTEGVSSLAALKQLPGLKRLDVTKGAFDSDLQGFADTVKINLK